MAKVNGNPAAFGLASKAELLSASGSKSVTYRAELAALLIKNPGANRAQLEADLAYQVAARTLTKLAGPANAPQARPVAFNLSVAPAEKVLNDGSSKHAVFVDDFSQRYNTLVVTAGPNSKNEVEALGYNSAYSPISVGALGKHNPDVFTKTMGVAPAPKGTRSFVDIVAPGYGILVPGYHPTKQTPAFIRAEGTSVATPMVTAAAALLAEYVSKNLASFPAQATNPNLLKAMLLNSADKIIGTLSALDGSQEMLRTVLGLDNKLDATKSFRNWNQFDNVKDEYVVVSTPGAADTVRVRQETPLNPEFGAGALNVGRALVQLKGGQGGFLNPNLPNTPGVVTHGAIGWDLSAMANNTAALVNVPGAPYLLRKYENFVQFKPGSHLSVTLTWNRPVEMTNAAGVPVGGDYTVNNKFTSDFATKPPDLNLYLMPKGAQNLSDAVWASTSKDSSVEHFFFKLPTKDSKDHTGRSLYSATGYELWVTSKETTKSIPYGLAWWGEAKDANPANPFRAITGVAFNDTKGDGLRGTGEPGRAGALVSLLNSSDVVIDRTTTDWDGSYQFDVADGMYKVEVSKPRDAAFTTQDYGSDDTIDSDVSVSTGLTDTITVSGADVANIDAGLVSIPLGTVSGRAFNDANGDGLQGTGETGYAGVRVELATTDGEYAGSTETDANGDYTFTNVAPGEYVLYYARPTNGMLSPKDVGSDATDSDADPLTGLTDYFTLASGGAAVRDVGARAVGGSIAGVAYFDADADGVRDSGEEGMPDQGVELRDPMGMVIAYTTTESDGSYQFDELPPGSYSVTFTPEVYWQLTTSATQARTVTAGTTATADAGLAFTTNTGMIAGRVWVDSNGNGLQDGGEPARVGVTMELRAAGTSTVLGTTTTDDTGAYWFSWIAPGTYDVRAATMRPGTLANQGTDDTIDSDFDALTHLVSGIAVGSWDAVENVDAGLVNAAPVAGNDTAYTMQGMAAYVFVQMNDSDADGDALTVASVGAPAHGTTSISNGMIVYTPDVNFTGTDSFQYTVADGWGGTATATVNVTVMPNVPPPPRRGKGRCPAGSGTTRTTTAFRTTARWASGRRSRSSCSTRTATRSPQPTASAGCTRSSTCPTAPTASRWCCRPGSRSRRRTRATTTSTATWTRPATPGCSSSTGGPSSTSTPARTPSERDCDRRAGPV